MTQEQKFLLDNNLHDLIISNQFEKDATQWVYVSDALLRYKSKILEEVFKIIDECIDRPKGIVPDSVYEFKKKNLTNK